MGKWTCGISRGPIEWGELLYDPIWSMKNKYRYPIRLYFGLLYIGISIFTFIFIYVTDRIILSGIIGIFFIFCIVLLIILILYGISEINDFFTEMPTRIYSEGITLPKVTLVDGIKRKESLINFEYIFSMETQLFGSITQVIIFRYRITNNDEEIIITNHQVENLDKYLAIIRKNNPGLIEH